MSQQAIDYAAEQYGPQRKGEKVWDPLTYDKRFAELIVWECLKIVDESPELTDSATVRLFNQIKTHFGVGDDTV